MTLSHILLNAILEVRVNAAFGHHQLTALESIEDGFTTYCAQCGQSAYIGTNGTNTGLIANEMAATCQATHTPID